MNHIIVIDNQIISMDDISTGMPIENGYLLRLKDGWFLAIMGEDNVAAFLEKAREYEMLGLYSARSHCEQEKR